MKTFRYLTIAIFFCTVLVACKKDNEVTQSYKFEAGWSGKLGENKSTPDGLFVFVIKPGNIIERINSSGQISGSGPWAISGNTFTASYTAGNGIRVDLKADLSVSENKISGTWVNTADRKGTFYAVKKID